MPGRTFAPLQLGGELFLLTYPLIEPPGRRGPVWTRLLIRLSALRGRLMAMSALRAPRPHARTSFMPLSRWRSCSSVSYTRMRVQPAFEPLPPWTSNSDEPAAAKIGCPTLQITHRLKPMLLRSTQKMAAETRGRSAAGASGGREVVCRLRRRHDSHLPCRGRRHGCGDLRRGVRCQQLHVLRGNCDAGLGRPDRRPHE